MKIIAFYLPQYHTIPENDEWWGEGFTEWTNVRNAKPLFDGHQQPKEPLNDNYYDLTEDSVKLWQVDLAKKYGLYGFCFYHYWFNGKLMLERPIEQYLNDKEIDFPYCICWANPSWTKAWVKQDSTVLIKQEYGAIDNWRQHFDYLLPFFRDSRYIKVNGCPLFVIYDPTLIPNLKEMIAYFHARIKEAGFDDIKLAYQYYAPDSSDQQIREVFDYDIEFQPKYALEKMQSKGKKIFSMLGRTVDRFSTALFGRKASEFLMPGVRKTDYSSVWKTIIDSRPKDEKSLPGAFVNWDNTPRRATGGRVFIGGTPAIFKKYLAAQIRNVKKSYNTDFLFLTAWNEWSEGSYLEPDKENGLAYLEAMHEALEEK